MTLTACLFTTSLVSWRCKTNVKIRSLFLYEVYKIIWLVQLHLNVAGVWNVKKFSTDPDANQGAKDYVHFYSHTLYQLSYRRMNNVAV